MKRLAFLIILVAGCSRSNTGSMFFAIDPATGVCTPLSGDRSSVSWQSCSDPCAALDERACKADARCQPMLQSGSVSCHAVPQPADPCKALDATACNNDSRCAMQPTGAGCICPSGVTCDCPLAPAPTCGLKPCFAISDADACNARPDCTTTPPPPIQGAPVPSGGVRPASEPATQCFAIEGCGPTERDCAKLHECMPSYDSHDNFTCGTIDQCVTTDDCALGLRCNSRGECVAEGCAGNDETECNADPHCDPVYSLTCSPYANGAVPDSSCGPNGAGGGSGTCTGPVGGPCEPRFTSCQDASGGVVTGKSVMVRDPAILDDPFWSLPRVLAAVSGADASAVADAWLAQLGTTASVDGKTSTARPGAAQYLASLPHRSDGLLDATQLGFVPTSLSNRLDLADGESCGEARITYALAVGATDRRHRMTIIVELRQPDDGAHCRNVAQSWLALGTLDGAALQAALQAIYTPLVTPANLKQVRTNEFLVGPQLPTQPPAAWELREFHLGADARLHQVLLPLQVDPAAVQGSTDFLAWVQTNSYDLKRGAVTFPTQYQVPNGSEDGSRVALADVAIGDVVNQSTCAGCHTTATNSAFAHVAERFAGTGRAEISQFLEGELLKRATHLALVGAGAIAAPLAARPLH